MLIRINVMLFETFTRISDVLPDPTAELSKEPLNMLAIKTIKNAAPKSLMVFLLVFILPSLLDMKSLRDGVCRSNPDCRNLASIVLRDPQSASSFLIGSLSERSEV